MGFLRLIGDFLFGKDPDIFDEQGKVRHKFSEEKWQKWNDRLKANPDYDWRKHGAKERALEDGKTPGPSSPKKHS